VHNGATAADITVANATLKKTYTCTVTATNSKGTSHPGSASNAVVAGAPAQVAKPSISKTSSGHLRVTFTNLSTAGTNGSPLTTPDYTATCSSSNGGARKSAVGTKSPITVASLTSGKTYACTVMAHNARGYGEASPASSSHSA
jgi:titin